ncbi:MAG: nickel-binding protein [Verrucomicrobiaceae bacterium]|uniref:nickel-binding protein n=1 Tax=Aestuariivirga sp. TaxID=2650926 RepID=UPI0030168366
MPSIIVERTFASPPSDEDLTAAGIRERPCLAIYGVAWRRSLLSADRLRMICQYDAPDAESVRKVQREAGNSFDHVWAGSVIE